MGIGGWGGEPVRAIFVEKRPVARKVRKDCGGNLEILVTILVMLWVNGMKDQEIWKCKVGASMATGKVEMLLTSSNQYRVFSTHRFRETWLNPSVRHPRPHETNLRTGVD